jgi:hypothetical protein
MLLHLLFKILLHLVFPNAHVGRPFPLNDLKFIQMIFVFNRIAKVTDA